MRFRRALGCGYSLAFALTFALAFAAFVCRHVYLLYLFNAAVNAAAVATAGYEYSSSASGSSLRSVVEAASATATAAAAARRRMSMLLAIVDRRIYVSAHTQAHTHTATHTGSKVLPINILIFMANKFTSFALRGHFLFCFSFCCCWFSCIKGCKSNAINLCQAPGELYAIVNEVKAIFRQELSENIAIFLRFYSMLSQWYMLSVINSAA